MTWCEDEVGKHRKKRSSNVSKSRLKSTHKHKYEPCTFMHKSVFGLPGGDPACKVFTSYGTYCTVCGKIGERRCLVSVDWAQQFRQQHPDALEFEAPLFEKFVPV